MSKMIDFDKPLSDEDRAWLHGRSLDWKVEANDRRFGNPAKRKGRVALSSADVSADVPDAEHDASAVVPSVPVPGEDIDLSRFDKNLVTQVKGLDDKALAEELQFRGVVAVGTRAQLEEKLLEKVEVASAEAKGE